MVDPWEVRSFKEFLVVLHMALNFLKDPCVSNLENCTLAVDFLFGLF